MLQERKEGTKMKYPNNFFLIMAALFGVSRDDFESYPVKLQSFLYSVYRKISEVESDD